MDATFTAGGVEVTIKRAGGGWVWQYMTWVAGEGTCLYTLSDVAACDSADNAALGVLASLVRTGHTVWH